MIRRHPILITAIAFLLLLVAGLIFVATYFDGDAYYEHLQAELSAALGYPVQLGQTAFTLKRGPALAVSDIHIDAEQAGISFRAELLYLRLEWSALLRGKIEFSRILLTNPRFHILLLPGSPGTQAASPPRSEVRNSFPVSSLAVEGGHIVLEDRRIAGRTRRVELEGVSAEITDLAPDHPSWVRLTGRLPSGESSSTLVMAGEIVFPHEPASWQETRVRLGILIDPFHPRSFHEEFLTLPDGAISGEGRLELTLDGTPAEGFLGTLRLGGSGLALHLSQAHPGPIAFPALEISGTWVADGPGHALRDISLKLDDITLQGELNWPGQKDVSWLNAKFHSAPFALSSLGRYLPDGGEAQREHIFGTLELSKLEFAGPTDLLRDPDAFLSHISAEAHLHDGEVHLSDTDRIQEISAKLLLEEGALFIEEGRGRVLDAPVRFSGVIDEIFSSAPTLQAEAQGEFRAENFTYLLPPEAREEVALSGSLPLSLGVIGWTKDLRLDAQVDLNDLSARWEPKVVKDAGQSGSLALSAQVGDETWSLDFARLRLPGLDLRANGLGLFGGSNDIHLNIAVSVPDLQAAHSLIPSLKLIDARGGLAIRGEISRSDSEWTHEGTLFLRGAGLRPRVVADINQANGSIRLTENGAQIEKLTARLGTSVVSVDGELENFSDPSLRLHVRASAIRADEIIFTSPSSILRDIDGRLVIERDRVAFSPISVRLDGGTIAVVEGEVRDFSSPVVELDIQASYGDIDEVIALWAAPREKNQSSGERGDHNTRVRISAGVKEGKIGNLKFEQAEGIISWEQGLLTIHPLNFHAAQGTCTGRVMVERREEGHYLFVSGHAEDIEAADLQRELLHSRGLISGRLRGDFFVSGEIGADFRRTSQGGIHLEVQRGVLKRYKALSKIFSILNISQIFARQLPDIAREGMPFNRLSATVSLKEGLLQTEDLLIDSYAMNMSLVGEIDLVKEEIDALVGVKPLGTVDKIITRVPVAGWLLTGEEEALITAHFQVRGSFDEADVFPVPITSISEKAVGIFRRLFGLPARFVENIGEFVRPEIE